MKATDLFVFLPLRVVPWVTQVVLAALLVGCGGGSDGTSSPASGTSPTVTVTSAVDSALVAQGALVIAQTMTAFEAKPLGAPIAAQAGKEPVIYALDAGGNVALAANVINGSAVFSAEGTVIALGATVLETLYPTATPDSLKTALRGSAGFADLVREVKSAVLAGKNPLDESVVQAGFNSVLTAAARTGPAPQGTRMSPARVATPHALDTYEPSLFETPTYKIVIANKSSEVLKFDSTVLFRNTSTLTFRAALLDIAGAERASGVLKGSGPTIFTLQGVEAQKVDKPFAGSFSVRLSVDEELTQLAFLKEALEIPKIFDSACIAGRATIAVKQFVTQAGNIVFAQNPEGWVMAVLPMVWDVYGSGPGVLHRGGSRIQGVFFTQFGQCSRSISKKLA